MKKISLAVILLIAAALLATPYFIGAAVKKIVYDEHRQLAENAILAGVDVELIDYQRQWLHAEATTRVSFPIVPEEEVFFDLSHRINHLPSLDTRAIATIETEPVLSSELKEELAPLFGGESPLRISTSVFLDGRQEVAMYSPAASGELNGQEGVAVQWQGLRGSFEPAPDDRVIFDVNMPEILIEPAGSRSPDSDLEALNIAEVSYDGYLKKAESGFWLGETRLVVADIDLKARDETGEAITMHAGDIEMQMDSAESDGLIRGVNIFKADLININGFEMTDTVYASSYENLDAGAFRAWQVTLTEMMKDEDAAEQHLASLVEHLPALVNAGPAITINDFSAKTPKGRFAINMDSRITGEWDDMLLYNPAMIITMLQAELNVSVPRAFMVAVLQDFTSTGQQTVNQQLSELIDHGYIREAGAQLEAGVKYGAGQLTINGMDASPLLGVMIQ